MKNQICFRCRNQILPNSEFFAFQEWIGKDLIRTDYAHKECWNNFLKQISDTTEAMSVVRGLKGTLTKMGMLEPEEVVIR